MTDEQNVLIAMAYEVAAKIADEHLARVPNHHPDMPMPDLVAQGYGNAALNIGKAMYWIETGLQHAVWNAKTWVTDEFYLALAKEMLDDIATAIRSNRDE